MDFRRQIGDLQLSRLGLAAEIDFYQSMAIHQLDCEWIKAFVLGVDESDLNLVIDTQMSQREAFEKIDQVVQFYKQHSQVKWRWMIGPLSNPKDLFHYLQQKGFSRQADSPGMYLDLAVSEIPVVTLRNWEIRELSAEDDLSDWAAIISEAFPNRRSKYQILNTRIPHGPNTSFRHYVGYYQGEPVSSITLFLSAQETVMLHNLATKKIFCNRGFGKKMLLHAISEAQKMSFKHCFLEASEKGFSLYHRLGFKVYCVYQIYTHST